MDTTNPLTVARAMIQRHGLRAQAVAMDHVTELRQQGDAAGREHWEQVHSAICELRRTANAPSATRH